MLRVSNPSKFIFKQNATIFKSSESKNKLSLFLLVLIIFFTLVIFRKAWLSDDSYITFRVIDNFINGFGLRWNVAERVQVFTHPLWMFLISLFYFFIRDFYWITIIISVVLSIITLVIVSRYLSLSKNASIIALLILIFSHSFIDYSTSGLENPLSHLIITLFFIQLFSGSLSPQWLFRLSLIASFGMVNRMDLGLIFLPSLFYGIWMVKPFKKSFIFFSIGQLPFIIWETFSIWYYGFPFPNTIYAKVFTDISQLEYIRQGFLYFLYTIQFDPITIFGLILSLSIIIKNSKRLLLLPALGLLLYLIYIIIIGGDFMGGRFFSVPLLCSIIIFVRSDIFKKKLIDFSIMLIVVLAMGLFVPYQSTLSLNEKQDTNFLNGIANEREYYNIATNVLTFKRNGLFPDFRMAKTGINLKITKQRVAVLNTIGMSGVFAGPGVHIVDKLALADPLLARIPALRQVNWRIGHMTRAIPKGYIETLTENQNLIEDKQLAFFYDRLNLITRGELFSLDRLKTILKMNLGMYNSYIDKEYYQYFDKKTLDYQAVQSITNSSTSTCNDKNSLGLTDSGLEIS
jgi:arabinofuranosyltransferase